jgi:hypothetical protein
MQSELSKATTRIGYLLNIYSQGTSYRFQNFVVGETIVTNNNTYIYVPIDYTPPAKSLDLENASTKIRLPNFPDILEAVEQNDGFRNAIVQAIAIFPDNSNANHYASDLLVVAATKVLGAVIEFDLQSPFSAVNALFPSIFFTTGFNPNGLNIIGFVPEIPVNSRTDIS